MAAILIFVASSTHEVSQSGPGHQRLAAHILAARNSKKKTLVTSATQGALASALIFGVQKIATLNNSYDYEITFSHLINYLAVGAALGALAGMWSDAFKNSSPLWLEQMKQLDENKESINKDEILLVGVPLNQVDKNLEETAKTRSTFGLWWTGELKRLRKAYLLSETFHYIKNAFENDHYEIYLMPKDEKLVTIFLAVNTFLQPEERANKVAFLALRPTPGITKSAYNSKVMPRIILGFKNDASKDAVEKIVTLLSDMLQKEYPRALMHNAIPRYSRKIDGMTLFHAYGSADFKEGAKGTTSFLKPASGWRITNWFAASPSDYDMAYNDTSKVLELKQAHVALYNLRQWFRTTC